MKRGSASASPRQINWAKRRGAWAVRRERQGCRALRKSASRRVGAERVEQSWLFNHPRDAVMVLGCPMPRWPSLSRRKRWLLAIVVVAAITGICFSLLLNGENRITLSNFRELKDGMTRDEVEQILGGLGSDGSEPSYLHWLRVIARNPTDWTALAVIEPDKNSDRRACVSKNWYTTTSRIGVTYDEGNRLLAAWFLMTFDPHK